MKMCVGQHSLNACKMRIVPLVLVESPGRASVVTIFNNSISSPPLA